MTDTGCGIPPSVLPRIFEPFFTPKPIGMGTGLGLSVCHGIITGLGGELSAFSEPGQGATFRVELPVAGLDLEAPTAVPRAPGGKPLVRRRVLIIDDEVQLLGALQRLLRGDFDVETESRAASALARLQRGETFDHILCDLQMPEMTGMDLFEALTRDGHPAATQIVFLTGAAVTERARRFIATTDRPVLAKPASVASLRELLADKRGG